MRMMAAVAAMVVLAACGSGEDQPVGGLSAEEAAQLNDAAEMLDASPDSMVAPEDMPLDGESRSEGNGAE